MPENTPDDNMICDACGGSNLETCGTAPFYTAGDPIISRLIRCMACGTWFRDLDVTTPAAVSHFRVASYTNPDNETRFLRRRSPFFRYIYNLSRQQLGEKKARLRMLDVGCSYGHLLDIFAANGHEAHGIEINEELRARCHQKGHVLYQSAEELPTTATFDVIAIIDTLYYYNEPAAILRRLREHLAEDGLLIIRVTNRTHLLKIARMFRRPITTNLLGDSKWCFSPRGIQTLCRRTGFRIRALQLREPGKRFQSRAKSLYYSLTPVFSRIVGYPLTPGIILICQPDTQPDLPADL